MTYSQAINYKRKLSRRLKWVSECFKSGNRNKAWRWTEEMWTSWVQRVCRHPQPFLVRLTRNQACDSTWHQWSSQSTAWQQPYSDNTHIS